MFKFRKDHPYRPVNWRWERARIIKEFGTKAPGQDSDDQWVKIAVRFRTLKDKCRDEATLYRLFDLWPDLSMAYELWDEFNMASKRCNPMKYEIEARFLARESLSTISSKSGLSESTLEFYENIFFNVNDKIDNKMYIFHVAIGDEIHKGMTDRDYAILWKLYGYVRGSNMLDYLISSFIDWGKPKADQVNDVLMEDYRNNMRRKAALASRMTGINHHNADRLIELHTKITEIEKSIGNDSSREEIQNNIQVMLTHLPLLVGNTNINNDTDPISKYHGLTADLRAHELLSLSAGQEPVDTKEFSEFKFPEPVKNEEIK